MGIGADISSILEQYGNSPAQPTDHVEQDFDQVAQQADPEELRQGLSESFRSDQTPPFGDMIGQLFGQADPQQRSGMLNQLLTGVGPALIGSLLGGRGAGGLGGLLGGGAAGGLGGLLGSLGGGQQPQVSPEEVERLRPEEIQDLANRAEKENPGIIDHMSKFYAENPTMVKALGGAALAIVLGKMAQRNR
ncbi:MAG: hypothetical protein V4632_17690 [Pseudomonadota bacterium]